MQKGLWKGKYFGSTIFRKLPIVMISIWVLHPFNLSDVPVTCFCDNRIRNLDNKIITDDVSLTLWRGNRHHVEGGGVVICQWNAKLRGHLKLGLWGSYRIKLCSSSYSPLHFLIYSLLILFSLCYSSEGRGTCPLLPLPSPLITT